MFYITAKLSHLSRHDGLLWPGQFIDVLMQDVRIFNLQETMQEEGDNPEDSDLSFVRIINPDANLSTEQLAHFHSSIANTDLLPIELYITIKFEQSLTTEECRVIFEYIATYENVQWLWLDLCRSDSVTIANLHFLQAFFIAHPNCHLWLVLPYTFGLVTAESLRGQFAKLDVRLMTVRSENHKFLPEHYRWLTAILKDNPRLVMIMEVAGGSWSNALYLFFNINIIFRAGFFGINNADQHMHLSRSASGEVIIVGAGDALTAPIYQGYFYLSLKAANLVLGRFNNSLDGFNQVAAFLHYMLTVFESKKLLDIGKKLMLTQYGTTVGKNILLRDNQSYFLGNQSSMREKLNRLQEPCTVSEAEFMHELKTAYFMHAWRLDLKRQITGGALVDHTTPDPTRDRLLSQDLAPTRTKLSG